jgi:hypothetical protein
MVIRLAVMLFMLASGARAEGLRLVVPDAQPVVSEMIPLVIRGEYTRQIALETLTFPNSQDYDWMQLSRDQWREEQVDGRTVRVFERRIALFPRHAGALTIGPVEHHLTVVGENNLRHPLVITAAPITLPVAPFPADTSPLSARSLTVEDKLSAAPGALGNGESLVRIVTITAQGTLPQMLPARPSMRQPWLISFAAPERREMQLTSNGPVTTVSWEWHLRPKTGEPGVLPAVSISWFDTVTRHMRNAEIPAIPFGYAGFGDHGSGADRLPVGQIRTAILAVGIGLAGGVAVALLARPRRRRTSLWRMIRRLSPVDLTRRRLKRSVETGDPLEVRRAAESYLQRRRRLGLPVTGRETARLDALLYGRNGKARAFDAKAEVRAIIRHRQIAED